MKRGKRERGKEGRKEKERKGRCRPDRKHGGSIPTMSIVTVSESGSRAPIKAQRMSG